MLIIMFHVIFRALEKTGKCGGDIDVDVTTTGARPSSDTENLNGDKVLGTAPENGTIGDIAENTSIVSDNKTLLGPNPCLRMQKQASRPLLPTPTSFNPVCLTSVISTNSTLTSRLAISMATSLATPGTSPRKNKKEDGWKEVGKRYSFWVLKCFCMY